MTNIQSGYLKTKNGVQLMTTVPYPIGAIYLSVDSTNPSKLFGGTWQQIAQGRTLVGVDTSQTEFNTVKKTGGEKKHTLTIDEMPSHKHPFRAVRDTITGSGGELPKANNEEGQNLGWGPYITEEGNYAIQEVGANQPHNNLQPYYTCYIWLKTA